MGIREVISSELAMIGGELSVRLIRQRIEASWSPHPWRHSAVQCSAVQCSAVDPQSTALHGALYNQDKLSPLP